ncbi:MAG: hypothetical protein JWL80_319 [Parcubacteria group bacterium]|nr:hypothetical protein [Parcubacteria group bacterium]
MNSPSPIYRGFFYICCTQRVLTSKTRLILFNELQQQGALTPPDVCRAPCHGSLKEPRSTGERHASASQSCLRSSDVHAGHSSPHGLRTRCSRTDDAGCSRIDRANVHRRGARDEHPAGRHRRDRDHGQHPGRQGRNRRQFRRQGRDVHVTPCRRHRSHRFVQQHGDHGSTHEATMRYAGTRRHRRRDEGAAREVHGNPARRPTDATLRRQHPANRALHHLIHSQ